MTKFRKLFIFVTLLFLLSGLLSVKHSKKASANSQNVNISVNATEVKDENISEVVELSGSALPKEEVKVSPKGEGNIISIRCDTGVHVKAGEVLAQIDNVDPLLAQQLAIADIISAGASKKGSSAKLDIAQANTKIAMANLIKAKNDLKRYVLLEKEGAISHLDFDRISTNFDVSKAQYEASKAGYDEAKSNYDGSRNSITSSNAELKHAFSQYKIAQKSVNDRTIRAPFAGYIVKRNIKPGMRVSPADVAYILVKNNILELVGTVPESDAYKLRVGQEVTIAASELYDLKLRGRIRKIEPYVDPQTRMQKVKITLPANKRINYGMYLTAKIFTNPKKTLVLPESAISFRNNKFLVFVVDTNDIAHAREVAIGVKSQGKLEITHGLKTGELVVTDGANFLNDGDTVNVYKQ